MVPTNHTQRYDNYNITHHREETLDIRFQRLKSNRIPMTMYKKSIENGKSCQYDCKKDIPATHPSKKAIKMLNKPIVIITFD